MELISYAMDFASFFMQNSANLKNVNSVILFGSVARGEATKKSDVDLFLDVNENENKIEKEVKEIKDKFYESVKFKNYWKLLDIDNEINVIVGKLKYWNLKDSMLGSSLILYSSYSPRLDKGKNKTILYWQNIKNNSKRVMLSKKIFGFKHYKRIYHGFLEKYEGIKLGANVILINTENLNIFLKEFRLYGVKTGIMSVFEYSK